MTMLLDKRCDVTRATESKSAFGGNSRSFATHLSGVRCRRHQVSGGEISGSGDSLRASVGTHRLWVDFGTDIVRTDRVTMAGVTYEVIHVEPDMGGRGVLMAITIQEVT